MDSGSLVAYVDSISTSLDISSHFRDDTWLAVFQSQSADRFLIEFRDRLLAENGTLLQRVLHLVRVGCKTVSPMSQSMDVLVRWHIPAGNAWAILLKFTAQNLQSIPQTLDVLLV